MVLGKRAVTRAFISPTEGLRPVLRTGALTLTSSFFGGAFMGRPFKQENRLAGGGCQFLGVGLERRRGGSIGGANAFLAHNHPCDPSSRADIQVTNRLRRLSAELELPLIEHVVVAGDGVRGVG